MKKKIVKWFKTIINDFNTSHCAMHAAGLTYFAMLSLVPLLCVLLSVAKICGADDFAREKINQQIDAMITNVERAQDDDLRSRMRSSNGSRSSTYGRSAGSALASSYGLS